MAAESGATASGQPSMRKITEASGTGQGKDEFKGECNHKKPVIDNWGNSAGFHAARQTLPRLTVHWLSVTRATEGPLSEISGPYFSLDPAAIDMGRVNSLDGPITFPFRRS